MKEINVNVEIERPMNKIILTDFQKKLLKTHLENLGYGNNFIDQYVENFGDLVITIPRRNGKVHLQHILLNHIEKVYKN